MCDRLQVDSRATSISREDYPCYTLKIRSGCEGGGKRTVDTDEQVSNTVM